MIEPAILAQHVSAFLESPYRPFLMLIPFIPWAWIVSSKLDKDARYFHLNVHLWSGIHLGAGAAALMAMLFVPIFWIGWPVGMLLLAAPVFIYWQFRNQQVPASQRFELTSESLGAKMEARRQAKASRDAAIQFIAADGEAADVPVKDDPAFATHMLAEDLLGPALDARASRIDVVVVKGSARAAQTIDGVNYKRDALPPDAALKVIDLFKQHAGLDVADRRRRQMGHFSMRGPSGGAKLKITTAGSSTDMSMRIEFDRAKRLSKPFDSLGMLASQMDLLASITEAHDRHGIVLIGAPEGHGLRTSMYSFIGRHDAYTSNIKTLEREVEFEIDGVDHVEWDPSNPDVDYATNMQSILRRDPDVIMTSFIKDRETAEAVTEPGMQGPLTYIPMRQPTTVEQLRAWVKMVGDLKRATKALRAVVNQRLLRTLCPNCRQPYQPTEDQLKKLGLPASKVTQLYRPGGKVQVKNRIENCPVCGGLGYLGQTGVFEVFCIDDDARKLLIAGDLKAALAHARRHKMIYLQEAALSKVASGETTIEEVRRVTAPAKAGASGGDAARPPAPSDPPKSGGSGGSGGAAAPAHAG